MQFVSNGFNIFEVNDSTHVQMLIIHEIFTDLFKYKCEALNCCVCLNIY